MKKLSIVLLLFVVCVNMPNTINQKSTGNTKQAVVIQHVQNMVGEILPDSLKKAEYPLISVDPCEALESKTFCDSLRLKNMNEFVEKSINQANHIILTTQGINRRPIRNDIGGGKGRYSIEQFPFTFKTTKYNDLDSFQIVIDSITAKHILFARIDAQNYQINPGDSVIRIDSIIARIDSTFCFQKITITQKILNTGLDSLPNTKYLNFF